MVVGGVRPRIRVAPPLPRAYPAGLLRNLAAIRSWVASGADVDERDATGTTPLMVASRWHCADSVVEFLRLGADVRRVNDYGRTAVHLVAERGKDGGEGAEVVRLLVRAGCDPAARSTCGVGTVGDLARFLNGPRWAAEVEGWVALATA